MHLSLRPSSPLILSLAFLLALVRPAAGQDKTDEDMKKLPPKESFRATTVDGVRLVGDFYPPLPEKGKEAACIILLHGNLGRGGSRKDFGKLPEKLQKEGYAVLAFDFRGHGESTGIEPEFLAFNPELSTRVPKKATTIGPQLFRSPPDFAKFGNDLMEAKLFLNKKSDAGACNSNNVCLIGADQGAVIGVLWACHGYTGSSERVPDPTNRRPLGLSRGPRVRIDQRPEGDDVSAIICLSMRPVLGGAVVENAVRQALERLRDNKVGFLVLYGQKDAGSAAFWRKAFTWIKPKDQAEVYDRTQRKELEKTELVGAKLLDQDALNTEKLITTYLALPKVLRDQPWQRKGEMELQQSLFATNRVGF